MNGSILRDLAIAAGVEVIWRDVNGHSHVVSDDSILAVLNALGFSVDTEIQIKNSLEVIRSEHDIAVPKMLTGDLGRPIFCPGLRGECRVYFETGGVADVVISDNGVLGALEQPGYHRLETSDGEIALAIAPASAFTLDDVAEGQKLWGLSVQLYSLQCQDDGGIGDFAGLAEFARLAAARGADAIAISPVHAQFSGDLKRFGPYAPSNRAALNILHVSQPSGFQSDADFISWPEAGAAKMAALRSSFDKFDDHKKLAAFRERSGIGLERHAIFETLQNFFCKTDEHLFDWRLWPQEFRDPTSAAVGEFVAAHAREVSFHAYAQYRAEADFGAAQEAARRAGMRIGLIADLAVGTDPAGSHSWSRQSEVLQGLEIGAPPDAINREGQSWGITAFAPRGLRSSGFAAFIDMLRHALRYAGGVRIDHIMGLARLWVIPQGFKSSEGAYLRMPVDDLLRLVALESQRHKAVILGEDLGTLPDGFQSRLESAGISGLRVLWFEKDGQNFKPPATWSKSAVAMTSTHDLPTVAGWWQAKDIEWREKLGMAGDTVEQRHVEQDSLWAAFADAGVSDAAIPSPENSAAAADAACRFLGATASTLVLLPIEDALALSEQPNLPGTVDEHPNWRRRLPDVTEALFDRPGVSARLAALDAARKGS
jgi:4-alpha-glucanotransferase